MSGLTTVTRDTRPRERETTPPRPPSPAPPPPPPNPPQSVSVLSVFSSSEWARVSGAGKLVAQISFQDVLHTNTDTHSLWYIRPVVIPCPPSASPLPCPPVLYSCPPVSSSLPVVEVLLYVHRNRSLIRDGSPGRPPRLSHSSGAPILSPSSPSPSYLPLVSNQPCPSSDELSSACPHISSNKATRQRVTATPVSQGPR